MRATAEHVLSLVPSAAEYADVRVVHRRHEGLHVENGSVGQALDEESIGVGIRVLLGGHWGFAATSRLDRAGLDTAVVRATAQARAAARSLPGRARLAPAPAVEARYETPFLRDPFEVPLGEKLDLLVQASEAMTAARGGSVVAAEASCDVFLEHKLFASTEGSRVEQRLLETGAGLMATAADGDDVQRRSYPQSVPRAIKGQRGDFATAGWEHVESLRLAEEAPRVGEEAAALLKAPQCPAGPATLVVSGAQMAQVVHETIGHPCELDRVLGAEASLAGGSYMAPDLLGRLQVGSPLLNVVADATLPGGLGSFGYDDEGVAARPTQIVRDGTFVGYLTSRGSAATLGRESGGAARADGWQRTPLVRMTNVSLEPGETPLAEILASTERGVLVDMTRSMSIDENRRSFRFGAEIGWEIVDGQVGRILKNPTYADDTLRFWASCDAVGDADSYRVHGIPSCNKGEPLQVAHIGHGTVPARFRDVPLGLR